jgi:lipopolysaccharide assembly protein A
VIYNTRRALKLFVITVITMCFIVFSVVNRDIVRLSLFPFPYSADMPLFLFALLCFSIGMVVGWLIVGVQISKHKRLLKSEHQRVMALENEMGAVQATKHTQLPLVR